MSAAHAKLSPSAASRWMNCPGSVALCATVPRKSSSFADEGTAAHGLAERCLIEKVDAAAYVGRIISVLPRGTSILKPGAKPGKDCYEVNDEMVESVQMYLDAVREPGCQIVPEARLSLEHYWPGMFGTADAQAFDKATGTLHVFDLKYGAGVLVAPDWNPQAMIYALGALGPEAPAWVENVRIVIVQPRHRNGGVMDWTIPSEDLMKWANEELVPAAHRTMEKDAPLVAGDKQCRFCDAKAICPALLGKSLEIAQTAFKDVITEPKTVHLPDPASMTTEQIANVLDFSELLSSWVSAVNAHAEQIALNGGVIPGRKLVRKTTRRKWIDEAATAQALAPLGEALYERKLKSPAQVEKLVKDKDAKKSLATLWENPEGELTLVHESDRRQGVQVNLLAAFYDDL